MSEAVKDQAMIKFKQYVDSGDFKSATKLLEEMKLSPEMFNYHSAFLEYNKENFVEAKYLLSRAKYTGLISQEVNSAMDELDMALGVKDIRAEFSLWDKFIIETKSFSSDLTLSFCLLFSVVSLYGFMRKKAHLCIVTGVLALVIGIFQVYTSNIDMYYSTGKMAIRNGPSRIFEEVQVVPPGLRFIIKKKYKNWSYITYPSIYEGWVRELKAIKL